MPSPVQNPAWWHRDVHAERRPFLLARARILAAVRDWFATQGFVEVDTALLQISPGNETHLHAFATELIAPSGEKRQLFLPTSPEFACKKLLAAGETNIFTLAPAFRNRERGALHHPQFTMLEWYRANEPYERLMDDCAALMGAAAKAVPMERLRFRGHSVDPFAAAERITVAEAFARFAGIDLLATLRAPSTPSPRLREEGMPVAPDRDALAQAASAVGIRVADDDTWADIFTRVLIERIEPNLLGDRAVILAEYPAQLAALARPKASEPRVAERFELYVCGVELANAFAELTDPVEQRRRLEAEMTEKQRLYGERYPIDEDFLTALAHMPHACGAALGLDRLAMLATGADHIEQVLWTPVVG